MLQRTNTIIPQTHTQNSEENDVALALIRFRSGGLNDTPIVQSPVKEVPFDPQQNRRRGIFTLCGRKPIANYPYQGPTKNGKPHTEKNEKGVEFFEIAGNMFMYVGSYCEGNPHGNGVLYRNLDYHWTTIDDTKYVCGMKIEVWKEKSKNFKDFSFLDFNKDFTCMYVGTFSKKKPFHITGKGVYQEHDCTIRGKFKTEESESDTKALLFKFDGKVHIDYRNGDSFDGLLHDYDEFYPSYGIYRWKEGHWKSGSFSDPYSNDKVHAVYTDGKDLSVYHGKFLHWKKHGAGTLTFSSGETFAGVWDDDVPITGVLTTPKKDHLRKYTGNVDKSFKANGNGKMEYFQDKELTYSFEGSFKNGKPHGGGTETRIFKDKPAGTRIVTGTWQDGTWMVGKECFTSTTNPEVNYQRKGVVTKGLLSKGTYWHANGDEYHGNFDSNGQASGFGILSEQSGKFSFGKWHKNKQHGEHVMFQRGILSSSFGVEPKEFNFTESTVVYNHGTVAERKVVSKKRKQSDFETFKKNCRQKLEIP